MLYNNNISYTDKYLSPSPINNYFQYLSVNPVVLTTPSNIPNIYINILYIFFLYMCKLLFTLNNCVNCYLHGTIIKNQKIKLKIWKQTHYERGSYPLSLFYSYFHIHKFIFSHTQIQGIIYIYQIKRKYNHRFMY